MASAPDPMMRDDAAPRTAKACTDAIPRIGRGFRLQWEPVQNAHVLLYPEGMVKLNGSAGEILTRCDGATPVANIVTDLESRFQTQGLDGDVRAFLDIATERRWVEWS